MYQYLAGGYFTLKQKQVSLFLLLDEWSTADSIVHDIIVPDCIHIVVSYVYGIPPPSIVLPSNSSMKLFEANNDEVENENDSEDEHSDECTIVLYRLFYLNCTR
jgi:hypothetical protein